MKHHIINLKVSMYKRAAISRLCPSFREEADNIVEMGNLAHGLVRFNVGRAGLVEAESTEECDLAVVEAFGLAEARHADAVGGDAVIAGELANCVVPPTRDSQ